MSLYYDLFDQAKINFFFIKKNIKNNLKNNRKLKRK